MWYLFKGVAWDVIRATGAFVFDVVNINGYFVWVDNVFSLDCGGDVFYDGVCEVN